MRKLWGRGGFPGKSFALFVLQIELLDLAEQGAAVDAEDIRRFRPLPVVAAERFEQVFPLEAVQRRGQRFLRQGLAVFGLAGACLPPGGKLSRADLQCAELDLAERQITVQRIVQLADVARPVVLHERLHDLAVEGGEIPDAGIGVEEVLDEQGDVLLALAQGGQVDRDDVDAVVEVAAHGPFIDALKEIPVRGRDDAYIRSVDLGAADRRKTPVLDGAEQLHLPHEADFSQFIEEKRAPIGLIQIPFLVGRRTGERALLDRKSVV